MARSRITGLILFSLVCCGVSRAAEEVDRATLRKEIAELKTIAALLVDRISTLESQLDGNVDGDLKLDDIVIVLIPREIEKGGGDDSRNPIPQAPTMFPAINATIVEVQPNGDYVLSGHHSYTVNGVRHEETLTGVAPRGAFDELRRVHSNAICELRIANRGQPDDRPIATGPTPSYSLSNSRWASSSLIPSISDSIASKSSSDALGSSDWEAGSSSAAIDCSARYLERAAGVG